MVISPCKNLLHTSSVQIMLKVREQDERKCSQELLKLWTFLKAKMADFAFIDPTLVSEVYLNV